MKSTIALVLALVAILMAGSAYVFIKPVQTAVNSLGGTPGADSNYPCETHNGIQTCFYNVAMNQGSTTACSLRSPSATSTLARAPFASWTVGSTTAAKFTISKGAAPNASTTLLVAADIAAGAQGTVVASSTATGTLLDGTNVVAPNTYINFTWSGGSGTFSPTGRCIGEFETVSPSNR